MQPHNWPIDSLLREIHDLGTEFARVASHTKLDTQVREFLQQRLEAKPGWLKANAPYLLVIQSPGTTATVFPQLSPTPVSGSGHI